MSRPVRAYTHEASAAWLPRDVLTVAGEPSHVCQGRVLAFARTALAARALLVDLGLQDFFSRKNPRVAFGNDLDALAEAGMVEEGKVYVVGDRSRNVVLVHFDSDIRGSERTTTRVGEIECRDGKARFVPVRF